MFIEEDMNLKNILQKIRRSFVQFTDARILPYYAFCGGRTHGWVLNSGNTEEKCDRENKFMLIQKDHINAGVMEDYVNFLLAIDFALSRGMIPVIDRLTYPAKFQQEEKDWGIINSWEIYFEQPFKEYDVDYVKRNAAFYVEANPFITFDILEVQAWDGERFMRLFLSKKEDNVIYAKHLKNVASRYIRFNSETENAISNMARKVFKNKQGKVLAVSVREEMFLRNEPTSVKLDNLLTFVEEKMKEFNCTHIFIASEFESRIEQFIKYFGKEIVFFLERKRPHGCDDNDERQILELSLNYTDTNCKKIFKLQEKVFGPKYNRWLNYLAEIYCVSQCDSAILQTSSGNTGALLMKKGQYDNVIMLNDLREFKE